MNVKAFTLSLIAIGLPACEFSCERKGSHELPTRSGMGVEIDPGTGCHYLKGERGHLIPRMDPQGKQICRLEDQQGDTPK